MKQFNYFEAIYLSFFSADFYRDVKSNWKGYGFLYLTVLLAFCWVITVLKMQVGLTDYIDNTMPKYINQIPKMSVVDGVLKTEEEHPYFIKDIETGSTVAIIDMTGEHSNIEDENVKILVSSDFISTKKDNGEIRSYPVNQFGDITIEREDLEKWASFLKYGFSFVALPFFLFFSFLYRMIQAFVYGGIGMLISNVLKVKLDYQILVRISVMAITPVIILETIRDLADVEIPYWGWLCFLIAVALVYFGIQSNRLKPESESLESQNH